MVTFKCKREEINIKRLKVINHNSGLNTKSLPKILKAMSITFILVLYSFNLFLTNVMFGHDGFHVSRQYERGSYSL